MISFQYLSVGLVIYIFNLLPAFTPPTWMVLSVFSLKYHMVLFPMVVIGAFAATCGRMCLALLAKRYLSPFLSHKSQKNLSELGHYLNAHHDITVPLILTYAFLPFPSNQIFLAAGLANVDLKILGYSFFIGRLISYTFWVSTSHVLAKQIIQTANQQTGKATGIIFELLGVLMLLFLIKFDWGKYVLERIHKKHE